MFSYYSKLLLDQWYLPWICISIPINIWTENKINGKYGIKMVAQLTFFNLPWNKILRQKFHLFHQGYLQVHIWDVTSQEHLFQIPHKYRIQTVQTRNIKKQYIKLKQRRKLIEKVIITGYLILFIFHLSSILCENPYESVVT